MLKRRWRAGGRSGPILIGLLGTAIWLGCGGGGTTPGTGGGHTSSSSSGMGGMGGATSSSSSGTGGTGGTGGSPASDQTAIADLVNAGGVTKSTNFKMISTLGQPTQNQSTTTSPTYRMQGGLVGANGSLP